MRVSRGVVRDQELCRAPSGRPRPELELYLAALARSDRRAGARLSGDGEVTLVGPRDGHVVDIERRGARVEDPYGLAASRGAPALARAEVDRVGRDLQAGHRHRPGRFDPEASQPDLVRAASRVVEQQQAGLAHSALTWSELHHDLAGLARSDPPSRAVLALDLEVAQLSRARPHAADHEGSRADISHAHGLRRSGPAHLPAAEVGGIRRDFHPWQRRRLSPGLHGASPSHLMGAAHGVGGEDGDGGDGGFTVCTGAGLSAPTPFSVTRWGLFRALSVITSCALRGPSPFGEKRTSMSHSSPDWMRGSTHALVDTTKSSR